MSHPSHSYDTFPHMNKALGYILQFQDAVGTVGLGK